VTEHFDVAVYQVRAGSAGSAPLNFQSRMPASRLLEVDELTILTGWAQALSEAVAFAPECIELLLADAHADAPWRAALGIAEPSRQLSEAITFMDRAVQAVTPADNTPTLDALLSWCRDQHEQGLDGLVRRVLRSTLEQLITRQASETRPSDFRD
jgi:hypothetical protein